MKHQRNTHIHAGGAVVFIVGLLLALFTDKGDALLIVDSLRSDMAVVVVRRITDLGAHLAYITAIVVALFIKFRYAVTLAINGLLTLFFSGVLKATFAMPRPIIWLEQEGLNDTVVQSFRDFLEPTFDSFPSGHSMAAMSLYGFCALVANTPIWKLIWLSLATLICLSRIYLGFHFLQDVIFGAFVGSVIAIVGYYIQQRYLSKLKWSDQCLRIKHTRT